MADFDKVIERRGTDSLKYDFAVRRGRPADVLPLWVADMDFEGPECVISELTNAVKDGIFGYSDSRDDYFEVLRAWFLRRHSWEVKENWLVKTPGVVFALAAAVRGLTNPGDRVLIQTPVYYPFFEVIRDNGRKTVESGLKLISGRYEIDFGDFEQKIRDNNVRLFILCNPHNPVGRVWTEEELAGIWSVCKRYGVYVVSDEIHCDLTRKGYKHTTFLKANPDAADRTVICTAPSKTFNLAGLQVSNIFIPDPGIKGIFRKEIDKTGYSQLNMLGLKACKAAYRGGEKWLEECLDYLEGNLDYIRARLKKDFPKVSLIEPEGTYFAWMDFSGFLLTDAQLDRKITEEAKLWLDAGHIFGREGSGFQRLVYACPRSTLREAFDRLAGVSTFRAAGDIISSDE